VNGVYYREDLILNTGPWIPNGIWNEHKDFFTHYFSYLFISFSLYAISVLLVLVFIFRYWVNFSHISHFSVVPTGVYLEEGIIFLSFKASVGAWSSDVVLYDRGWC
jgi:hypothetical protein